MTSEIRDKDKSAPIYGSESRIGSATPTGSCCSSKSPSNTISSNEKDSSSEEIDIPDPLAVPPFSELNDNDSQPILRPLLPQPNPYPPENYKGRPCYSDTPPALISDDVQRKNSLGSTGQAANEKDPPAQALDVFVRNVCLMSGGKVLVIPESEIPKPSDSRKPPLKRKNPANSEKNEEKRRKKEVLPMHPIPSGKLPSRKKSVSKNVEPSKASLASVALPHHEKHALSPEKPLSPLASLAKPASFSESVQSGNSSRQLGTASENALGTSPQSNRISTPQPQQCRLSASNHPDNFEQFGSSPFPATPFTIAQPSHENAGHSRGSLPDISRGGQLYSSPTFSHSSEIDDTISIGSADEPELEDPLLPSKPVSLSGSSTTSATEDFLSISSTFSVLDSSPAIVSDQPTAASASLKSSQLVNPDAGQYASRPSVVQWDGRDVSAPAVEDTTSAGEHPLSHLGRLISSINTILDGDEGAFLRGRQVVSPICRDILNTVPNNHMVTNPDHPPSYSFHASPHSSAAGSPKLTELISTSNPDFVRDTHVPIKQKLRRKGQSLVHKESTVMNSQSQQSSNPLASERSLRDTSNTSLLSYLLSAPPIPYQNHLHGKHNTMELAQVTRQPLISDPHEILRPSAQRLNKVTACQSQTSATKLHSNTGAAPLENSRLMDFQPCPSVSFTSKQFRDDLGQTPHCSGARKPRKLLESSPDIPAAVSKESLAEGLALKVLSRQQAAEAPVKQEVTHGLSGGYVIDISDHCQNDPVLRKPIRAPQEGKGKGSFGRGNSEARKMLVKVILVGKEKVLISTPYVRANNDNFETPDTRMDCWTSDSSRNLAGQPLPVRQAEDNEFGTALLSTSVKRRASDGSIVETLVKIKNGRIESVSYDLYILNGRPCPQLEVNPMPDTGQNISQGGPTFSEILYKKVPWLTGLPNSLSFLCWPCLIFEEFYESRWSVPYGMGFECIWSSIKKHELTPLHIASFAQLKHRESQLSQRVAKEKLEKSQEHIKSINCKWRLFELLAKIIFSKKVKLAGEDSLSSFNYIAELMKLAVSYDEQLLSMTHVNDEKSILPYLRDLVKAKYQNLLLSLLSLVKKELMDDINNALFIVLIYIDTTPIFDRSVLAVAARYVSRTGKICERFIKFIEIAGYCTAEKLHDIHHALLFEFKISKKLIGFTYNGRALSPREQTLFHERLSSKQGTKFFHHYIHKLEDTILESFSRMNSCHKFLHTLSELVNFFEMNKEASVQLKGRGILIDNEANFNSMPGMIKIFVKHYSLIMEFLQAVSRQKEAWEFPMNYINFYTAFKGTRSRFLLLLLANILGATEYLSKAMETGGFDDYGVHLRVARNALNDFKKKNGFKSICQMASDLFNDNHDVAPDLLTDDCKQLVIDLVNSALVVISLRCNRDDPEFECADYQLVRLEQQVAFYNSSSFFKNKTIYQSLQFITENDLSELFPELVKLLQFQLTIPKKNTDLPSAVQAPTRLLSCMKKMKLWNPTDALLALEKDYILSMETKGTLFHDIVADFAVQTGDKVLLCQM